MTASERGTAETRGGENPLTGVTCVLFDLDGTLIDTLDLILSSMRHATETVLGEALPDDVLMHNVGVPLRVQMQEFDAGRAEELLTAYRAHNDRVHDVMVREYPGTEEALGRLTERGFRLGVVTSKALTVARRGLDRFSLGRYFDVLVTYDDVPVHKPDPHPLLHAAGLLGVEPGDCAYIGDSPHDMTAALAAGMVAVAATWGVAGRERVLEPGPQYVVDSMGECAALFDGHEAGFRHAEK